MATNDSPLLIEGPKATAEAPIIDLEAVRTDTAGDLDAQQRSVRLGLACLSERHEVDVVVHHDRAAERGAQVLGDGVAVPSGHAGRTYRAAVLEVDGTG